jgi:hypothetical protein
MGLLSVAGSAAKVLHDTLRTYLPPLDGALIVFDVGLAFTERDPEVTFELRSQDATVPKRTWRLAFSSLDAPSRLTDTQAGLQLPAEIADDLKRTIDSMEAGAGQPVWLNLLRPYGYLGVAPWERVLGELLERPIYRLPDVALPSRGGADVLEAAVVFDAPLTMPATLALSWISSIAHGILRSSSRLQTRLNVFAAAGWTEKLRGEAFDERVRVHDANQSSAAARETSTSAVACGTAPWFDWIASALAGRTVDAVHFVCTAEPTDTGAVLSLSHSPRTSRGPRPQLLIGVEEITTLLTRLGATTAMFSPADISSRLPMAFVADSLARCRTGPVLFHRLAMDGSPHGLWAAYSVLFGGGRTRARLADGFLYVSPSGAFSTDAVNTVLDAITQRAASIATRAPLSERWRAAVTRALPGVATHELPVAPNWAGAVQRYVEATALDQWRRVSGDVLLSRAQQAQQRPASLDTDTAIVSETLADIVDVTAKYLNKP